jgi:uncharacterized protein YegL
MAKQVNTMSTNQTTNAAKANVAKRIFNLIILDESGSMYGLEKMCVDGVNETIQTIKNASKANPDQKQMFSFITFSGRAMGELPIRVKTYLEEITNVDEFPVTAYAPNGCTPLFDAMGIALTELEKKVTDDDIALVTVITDGYENTSRMYSQKAIQNLVSRQDERGWVFTYIGANQDAMYESSKVGIKNSLNFCADEEGMKKMWEKERRSRDMFYQKSSYKRMNDEDLKENYFNNDNE